MNCKKIVDNITNDSIIKLMQHLGIDRYKDTKDAIIFPTICHNENAGSASMKLYYYKNSHLFYCYTECGGMSVFKFLENYYKTRGIEYDWFEDIYSLLITCCDNFVANGVVQSNSKENYQEKYSERQEIILPHFNEGVLDTFTKIYPIEWLNEGISERAMDTYNILYSISQNKIIIPHYNANSQLVGIRGRALDEEECNLFGKYMPVKIEKTWYKHPLSLNLYGLNVSKENIKKTGICFLFEGEKSCLKFSDYNRLNCSVAVCGSNFNKYALNILIKECNPSEIIICFDNEENKGSDEYYYKLKNICEKYSNYANFSFVYDRKGLTGPKDSPVDCGEDVFNKLIETRVKVRNN